MIVLGLSGLPSAQAVHLRDHPNAEAVDRRICQGLDSAACLVVDGEIVAAAAEERFTGEKGTGALPAEAIAWCLESAGIKRVDVDVIAHGFDYDRFRRYFRHDPEHFDEALSSRTVIDALVSTGWRSAAQRFAPVEHHVAHAASAYFVSGFERALSIVSDGMGEIGSLSVQRIIDGEIETLYRQGIEVSLGIAYSIVTRYLGYAFNSDEYKVMGLSAYGDPECFASFFNELIRHDGGTITVGWPKGALRRGGEGYPEALAFLAGGLGVPPRRPGYEVERSHADIAAALQARFTEVLTNFARHWLDQIGETALCLSGGSFLNCLANESIAKLPQVSDLFIPPAASDDGTAIGAALVVSTDRRPTSFSPYTGPVYGANDVHAALARWEARGGRSLTWEHLGVGDELLQAAAQDISDDKIIAWFSGPMEFGPRALGNRSILARPNGVDIKNRLNQVVKLREGFRPFAPAILESDYPTVFETPLSRPQRYMLSTVRSRPGGDARISGSVHVDGTARVQVVRREDNDLFWRLLTQVGEKTGLGCVINTSFNVKDQPIIMTPDMALEALATMSLDRLYMEGYRVSNAAATEKEVNHA